MDIEILATDYDGTLAWNGVVDGSTINAMRRLREAGKHAILVTGRELPDLRRIFFGFDLFELVVAENGGLLYEPRSEKVTVLGPTVPRDFLAALREANVTPLSVGHTIVATQEMNETVVADIIKKLQAPLEIRLNKGSVMVLPAGINKGSGLKAALREGGWKQEQTMAIGDGENDIDMFKVAGIGVAVQNAAPELRVLADLVTCAAHGEGVVELIERWLTGNLAQVRSAAVT